MAAPRVVHSIAFSIAHANSADPVTDKTPGTVGVCERGGWGVWVGTADMVPLLLHVHVVSTRQITHHTVQNVLDKNTKNTVNSGA